MISDSKLLLIFIHIVHLGGVSYYRTVIRFVVKKNLIQ